MAISATPGTNGSLGGINAGSPTSEMPIEEQLAGFNPEQLRQFLKDGGKLQELLQANGLFGVYRGQWDVANMDNRDRATQIVNQLKTLSLQIEALQENISDEVFGPQTPQEVLTEVGKGKALLTTAQGLLQELEGLAQQTPASTALQSLLEEGRRHQTTAQRAADRWSVAENEAVENVRKANERLRLQTTSSSAGFTGYVTQVITAADGTREYVPEGNRLLVNLTGNNDTLLSKVVNGIHYLNPNNEGWIRVPSNVNFIVIAGRSGDDFLDFNTLGWSIQTVVWGDAGYDTLRSPGMNPTTLKILDENRGFDVKAATSTPGTVGGSTLEPD